MSKGWAEAVCGTGKLWLGLGGAWGLALQRMGKAAIIGYLCAGRCMRGHDAEGAKGAQKPQKIPKRVLIWFGLIWFLRFTVPTSHSRVAPAPTASFPRRRESIAASKPSKTTATSIHAPYSLKTAHNPHGSWLQAFWFVWLWLTLRLAPLRFTAPNAVIPAQAGIHFGF